MHSPETEMWIEEYKQDLKEPFQLPDEEKR